MNVTTEKPDTDRELLEMAAKAAGLVSLVWGVDNPQRQMSGEGQFICATWNPLNDDGDALRLAVKLGLMVYVMVDAGFTGIRLPGEHIGGKYDEVELHLGLPEIATRRAIVRAAAEIGQSME